jgi:HSP20 family molecular chaperone IbpA
MEIDHGSFRREVSLPPNIDLEKVESVYANGLLWVHLPLTGPDPTGP